MSLIQHKYGIDLEMSVRSVYNAQRFDMGGIINSDYLCKHTLPEALANLILSSDKELNLKFLGKAFVFKTLIGAASISLFVQIFSYLPPMTNDIILATIFG